MAARPLLVGVTDLVRHPGSRRELQRSVALDGVAITTAAVPPNAELELDLVIEALSSGVVASGRITVPWVGACRRCLTEVDGVAETQVREIFERHPTEGETYPLGDDTVDLEPMVRDAALLALPLAPLCRDDCLGPAPDLFPARVEDSTPPEDGEPDVAGGDDRGDRGAVDPRWAALDQLKFD